MTYVVPTLHPSGVIRNRGKWEPLFISAIETVVQLCNTNSYNHNETPHEQKNMNVSGRFIIANDTNFKSIFKQLADEGYKLVDVMRYKDFANDQIIDEGIFAIVTNGNDEKFVLLNDVNLHYYEPKANVVPMPLISKDEAIEKKGPTVHEIVRDRYKALRQPKGSVYYNYDFYIDDWLIYQIKEVMPGEPDYRICYFDIEVHSEDGIFPDPRDAKYPISTVSMIIDDKFYQLVNKELLPEINERKVYDFIKQNNVEIGQINFIYCNDERELLETLAKLIKDSHIHVLTSWNIYFDINYIANRCKVLGFDTTKFSPVDKPMYPSSKLGYFFIPGIIVVDLLELYKSYQRAEVKYTLDYITNKRLGVSKVKYEGSLTDLLHNDPDLYIAYSAVDTKLIQMLDKVVGDLSLHLMVKDLSWTSFLNSWSLLAVIDGLMYQYASNENKVLRQKPFKANKEGAFVGAFVREPRTGYIPWVIDLDASSMYPSIMISLNISPETFVGAIKDVDSNFMEKMLLTNEVDNETVTIVVNPATEAFVGQQTKQIKVKDLKDLVKKHNLVISFAGTIFVKEPQGFIPKILDDLIKRRKVYKKKAKELLEAGNIKLGLKYDVIQKTLKILANAIYGASGNQAYRFFDTRVSVTITLTGQYEIKFVSGLTDMLVQKMIEANVYRTKDIDFKIKLTREVVRKAEGKQHYVFYSDTDSSFIDIFDLLALAVYDEVGSH